VDTPLETRLHLGILPQPDDFTCGPTCLHAVYRFFGDDISLEDVVEQTPRLDNGGTMAVWLACQALRRGYTAKLYSYNLQLIDPTWFVIPGVNLKAKLLEQSEYKESAGMRTATGAFLEFLELGGELRFEDLTTGLIRKYLNKQVPVLTGLSSTYLYRTMREYGPKDDFDDVRGEPAGHFVVLCGYDKLRHTVLVADPLHPNPVSDTQLYEVNIERLLCAILLGVLTYDANLLILQPKA
jgi:hypothetical protein